MPRPGEDPQTVSRPFDLTRDGFVLGEGAGSLFLEDLELAKARGATIYAEVVGYGSAADGWDMIQPIDAGVGSARAMQMALERRGVPGRRGRPDQPARHLDAARRQARDRGDLDGLRARARRRRRGSLAISATKSMTGHMMGAAGAFEAFATVKSVAEQCAPAHDQLPRLRTPTATCGSSRRRQALPIRYALSNNIGLGGHNGAVIFKRYDGD